MTLPTFVATLLSAFLLLCQPPAALVGGAESPPEVPGLEAAALRLEKVPAAQRDAALAALEALGPAVQPRLVAALDRRLTVAVSTITSGNVLGQLGTIADARKALDAARQGALLLIQDEERYFYPYTAPECPPERARLYPGVQQEVDALVEKVRAAWKSSRRAKISPNLRTALEELDWNRAERAKRSIPFTWPAVLPAWIDALDRDSDALELRSFAWDAKERKQFERDALVEAFNARIWQRRDFAVAQTPSSEEQKQVLVTNEYRKMFGVCALAWNPKLQASARGHSDYMAETGEFGHYEKDPTRKTPGDRMRLAGYKAGASENCHMGGGGAEGAHAGWTHSSGHHRNLLVARHRELGSAEAGAYWTQNFGSGNDFERDLQPAGK